MTDIIELLPDSVANQIAAGEVVQRPSSVVKELVENSIDAGATTIKIIIKDAGRTLIQVIDNGKGMSEHDARKSFERHATSKIKSADDLFSLSTMGFRGEALASIAAVAQVELKTRREEDEIGTHIIIAGSKIESQEPISTVVGTNFMVKNLFFNVPARRKFLKKDQVEMNHILEDFRRIALIYENINFVLIHNDGELYNLKSSNSMQRIVDIFGKKYQQMLYPINVTTEIIKIKGYIAKPETATKGNTTQYFFINGRYMQHPYFHKAVMTAYDRLLHPETRPSYFIRFEASPQTIDVNIHPTKTEIKFENEQIIWPILSTAVKEALGKFIQAPVLDFEQEDLNIPTLTSDTKIKAPTTHINTSYNPFHSSGGASSYKRTTPMEWEALYKNFNKSEEREDVSQTEIYDSEENSIDIESPIFENKCLNTCVQYKNKYIITTIDGELVYINQHRAHERILFEQYLSQEKEKRKVSQQLLFPEMIELHEEEVMIMDSLMEDLSYIGYDIGEFGKNTYVINGIPDNMEQSLAMKVIQEIINIAKTEEKNIKTEVDEFLAETMARSTAIPYGKTLSEKEMQDIVNQLFKCKNQNYSPKGKTIIIRVDEDEIEKKFK